MTRKQGVTLGSKYGQMVAGLVGMQTIDIIPSKHASYIIMYYVQGISGTIIALRISMLDLIA